MGELAPLKGPVPKWLYHNRNYVARLILFMLVSALMGLERMQAVYAHAIAEEYRFYSYGDSSLLLP